MKSNNPESWDPHFHKKWREAWLTSLFEFANIELQRMSWLEGPAAKWPGGDPWVSSFVECFCNYFDDLAIDSELTRLVNAGIVSQEEMELLAPFHNAASQYQEGNKSHEEILLDSGWQDVVCLALSLWKALRRLEMSPNDIRLMNALESKFPFAVE